MIGEDELPLSQTKPSTEWYNQNAQLYRTYLQSLFLRLGSSKPKTAQLIKRYLSTEEQLKQLITNQPAQDSGANIELAQYEDKLAELNKTIEEFESSIFKTKSEIQVSEHQQLILKTMLKMELQNFKKVVASFYQTLNIDQGRTQHTLPEQTRRFIAQEFVKMEDQQKPQQSLAQMRQAVKHQRQKIVYNQAKHELPRLQAEKKALLAEVAQIFQQPRLQEEIQAHYRQKQIILDDIKKTQLEIVNCTRDIEGFQIRYNQNAAHTKLLKEELNKLSLRNSDDIRVGLELDAYQFKQQPQSFARQREGVEQNKRIVLREQKPRYVHIGLAVWAVLLVLGFLIIV